MSTTALLDCVLASWHPHIGDPDVLGWGAVVGYGAAAALAALCVPRTEGRLRAFWLTVSILLLALAANKQLELQTALTAAGRCIAKVQGWYAERRVAQLWFASAVMLIAILVACLLLWLMRRDLAQTWLALLGLGTLFGFVAFRAAQFNHLPRVFGHQVGGAYAHLVLEPGGIGLIALNAAYLLMRKRGPGR